MGESYRADAAGSGADMTGGDRAERLVLEVEAPAAFTGAFVDALQRHDVEVIGFGSTPDARTLDTEHRERVPVVVPKDAPGIDDAVRDFLENYPDATVRRLPVTAT